MPTERLLVKIFVELADTLVTGFDIVDFLQTLADRCSGLFRPAEAGVTLTDQRGGLRLVASSSERALVVELFELQNEQGPCLDCFRTGTGILAGDLGDEEGRWPLFSGAAVAAGFRSAHSLPLRVRSQVIGVLNVFRPQPGLLDGRGLAGAQAIADMAALSILQERTLRDASVLGEQLRQALDSRIVVEQAKGVLAERARINGDEAFDLLRTYARSNHRRLHDVAIAAISSLLTVEEMVSAEGGPPARLGGRSGSGDGEETVG